LSSSQIQIGDNIYGEAVNDLSGTSISISGDGSIVAIGAYQNDGNGSNSGHVRVFQNISNTWTQIGADIDGDAADDRFGTSVSLSTDGTIVAIGAPNNNSNTGQVRVYENISGVWTQIGGDIVGEALGDYSGFSISLSGDGSIVAIGAHLNDGNGSDSGHVRVYENNLGTWTQIGSDIDGDTANDELGFSISLSDDGTILAIGSPSKDIIPFNSGQVRVYENISGVWTQIGSNIDGEAGGDYSGHKVSLAGDGSTVAIGADLNDGNGSDSGHVRVYKNILGTWTQVGADIDGEAVDDQSGRAISLSYDGNIIAIGAKYNDGNGSNSGHVRVFQNISNTWQQIGIDIDGDLTNDNLGYSVSLSDNGNSIAISAPYNDSKASNSGYVAMYDLSAEVLGISDEFVVKNFSVYPNPVSTSLYIQLTNELEFISASLFNYLGQSVLKTTKTSLNVSSLSKGMYFLKVQTDKGIGIKKVILN
jgi:Flp pilus assembly pilin Flp